MFKIDNILSKPNIPSFRYSAKASLRAHYSMVDSKTHASRNTLYFHAIVEILRRLIWYIMKLDWLFSNRVLCARLQPQRLKH